MIVGRDVGSEPAPAVAPPPAGSASSSALTSPGDGLKIIFLDIDGVICCNGMGRLETDKLARIADCVKKTEAKVVLSTDWRRDAALKAQVTNALTERGIQVIGATRKGPPMQPIRPKEIWGWLEAYQNDKGKVVSQWVAIDDRELLMEQGGENLRGHFVQTNFATGLTERSAERVVAVLNGNQEEGMGLQRSTITRAASPNRNGRRNPSPTRPAQRAPAGSLTVGSSAGGFGAAVAGANLSATAPSPMRSSGHAPRAGPPSRLNLAAGGQQAKLAALGAAPKPGISPTCARSGLPQAGGAR